MDDPLLVGVVEPFGNLLGEPQRLVDCKLPLPVELVPQRLAIHVRHDVIEEPVGLAGVVEGQDVLMGELGRELDLPQEAVGTDRCGQLGPQHLHGHIPLVADIVRQVDDGHPPTTQLALDLIAVREGGG